MPPGAPSHLEHLLDELNESLELDAPGTSLRVLRRTLGYMASYFADLIDGVSSVFGELNFPAPNPGDIGQAVEVIQKGLAFLQSDAPSELPEVKLLVDTFFENGAAKKFARILSVGGRPRRGSMALEKFVAAPIPVRKKCVAEIKAHIPYLKEWMEAAANLFASAVLVSERTSQEGRTSVKVRLGNQKLTVGQRIEVLACPLCIPEKEIEVPASLYDRGVYFFVPQKAPQFLSEILDRLGAAMEKEDPVAGCLELRNALEFLIRYFTAVSSKICEELAVTTSEMEQLMDQSASITASEQLLNLCLPQLQRHPDFLAAKTVISIFYRRNEMFEYVPRWHTEILNLSGQLAAWCQLEPGYGELEDPEVCKLEFEKHVSTLREWLVALGGYLQSTEHFFQDVKRDGSVEFSLRIGDRFLEISEPGYLLWVNNPRPEGEAVTQDSDGQAKPLIREPIDIPTGTPEVLTRILTRMDIYLRLGDPIHACLSLRDALDYLTRYFAGLAAAAFRELGSLPAEAEQLAQQSLSVHDCERLLILSLRSIGHDTQEKLGVAVRNVFYYVEEFSNQERPTGAHARLLALDADPSSKHQNLAEFCAMQPGEGALSHPARSKRELERFLPMLRDWLAMAEPFFREVKHHEEPPEEDGKTELVVEYGDYYLELVEPDYTFYIRPGSDVVPDIEAPDLPPPEAFGDDELVEEKIHRKSPEEAAQERPFMVHRVDLIGMRENSKGVKCPAGYIILTNAGGGTMSGTAVTTHEALEVEPTRFRGNKVQLSYWIDTENLPDNYEVFILLKTAYEERSISVFEMIGQATSKPISTSWAQFKMVATAVLWIGAFIGLFQGASAYIDSKMLALVGRGYQSLQLLVDAPAAMSEVLPLTHFVGYFYLFLAGIVPVLLARMYSKFPPSVQELLEGKRRLLMASPSLVVVPLLYTPVLGNQLTAASSHFLGFDFRGMLIYFLGLNLLSTLYQELSLTERFDDWFIEPGPRKAISYVAWFIFVSTVLLGVSS